MIQSHEYDFGFTAVEAESIPKPEVDTSVEAATPLQDVIYGTHDSIMSRIEALQQALLEAIAQVSALPADSQALLDEHKRLVTADVRSALHNVEQMILPLLYNLKKNPEKEYIHWPNREVTLEQYIQRLLSITQVPDDTPTAPDAHDA